MFMLTQGVGQDLGFPDTCNTPLAAGAPVPIPYPNVSTTATTEPTAENVLVDCMPAINLLSKGMVSVGDQAGVEMGVATGEISGETMYVVGCFTILVDGVPAQRLTSVTGQNGMGLNANAPGMAAVPSQVTVLSLG